MSGVLQDLKMGEMFIRIPRYDVLRENTAYYRLYFVYITNINVVHIVW